MTLVPFSSVVFAPGNLFLQTKSADKEDLRLQPKVFQVHPQIFGQTPYRLVPIILNDNWFLSTAYQFFPSHPCALWHHFRCCLA